MSVWFVIRQCDLTCILGTYHWHQEGNLFSRKEGQLEFLVSTIPEEPVALTLELHKTYLHIKDKTIYAVWFLTKAICFSDGIGIDPGKSQSIQFGQAIAIAQTLQLYGGKISWSSTGSQNICQLLASPQGSAANIKVVSSFSCEKKFRPKLLNKAQVMNDKIQVFERYSATFYYIMWQLNLLNRAMVFALVMHSMEPEDIVTDLSSLWNRVCLLLPYIPKQIPAPRLESKNVTKTKAEDPKVARQRVDEYERVKSQLEQQVSLLEHRLHDLEKEHTEVLSYIFQERMKTLPQEDAFVCKMCLNNTIDTLILPCGHAILCSECSELLSKKLHLPYHGTCVACRGPIQRTIKMYVQ